MKKFFQIFLVPVNWCGIGETPLILLSVLNQLDHIAGLKHVAGNKWHFLKISMRLVQG
jgi:hypothetical protein